MIQPEDDKTLPLPLSTLVEVGPGTIQARSVVMPGYGRPASLEGAPQMGSNGAPPRSAPVELDMISMHSVLAFDWGTTIIGILDVDVGTYTAYRGRDAMLDAARRLVTAQGTIVSFNGNAFDLPKLFDLLEVKPSERVPRAEHDDMLEIISAIRWPPAPGTKPIFGQSLQDTYSYYGEILAPPPRDLNDEYEESNWRDCYMTAVLWKRWKRGECTQ